VRWWRFRDEELAEFRELVDNAVAFGCPWHS
jgi:hypothetical protein